MTFLELSTQRLNLALVGLAISSWILTRDYSICIYCMIIEVWYFSLGWNHRPGFLETLKTSKVFSWVKRVKWQAMLSWFLIAYGVLVIAVVGAKRITIAGHNFGMPYERWEIAALSGNLVFAALSYVSIKNKLSNLVALIRLGGGIFFTKLAFTALAARTPSPPKHLACVLGAAAWYLGADFLDMFVHQAERHERRRCLETALYADFPTVLALGTLLVFCLTKRFRSTGEISIFLSGAIAFQFIASFLLLALIEGRACDAFDPPNDDLFSPEPLAAAEVAAAMR